MNIETQKRQRPGPAAWITFLPLVGWLLVLVILPTGLLVVYSFCDRDEDLGTPVYQFTLDNYRDIFEPELRPVFWRMGCSAACIASILVTAAAYRHRRFSLTALRWGLLLGAGGYLSYAVRSLPTSTGSYLKIFWRSAELAGLTTLLCLIIGYPVAYFVGRSTAAWRNRLLLWVMIPFWTSFLIRTYAWITILNENGLLNGLLKAVGFHPTSGILYTPAAVVIGLVYAYLPFMILPIYGSVEKLDGSLIEASLDLGAGPMRTLLNVVFPLTGPGVIAGILLVFVPAIGMFAVTDLMSGNRFPLLGSEIENQFGQANNQPMGAALGVTLLVMFGLVLLATGFGRPRELA